MEQETKPEVSESKPERNSNVEQVSITWSQPSDFCDPSLIDNMIKVQTCEAGKGPYVVIETNRWALSDDDGSLDQFVKRIRAVLKLHENPSKRFQ